jgi:hypothetical protein
MAVANGVLIRGAVCPHCGKMSVVQNHTGERTGVAAGGVGGAAVGVGVGVSAALPVVGVAILVPVGLWAGLGMAFGLWMGGRVQNRHRCVSCRRTW